MKKLFAAACIAGLAATSAQAEVKTNECQVYPQGTGEFSLSLDTDTGQLTLLGHIHTPGIGDYGYDLQPMTGIVPTAYADHELLVLTSPNSWLTAIGEMDIRAPFKRAVTLPVVTVHIARDWMWGPATIRCGVPKP